MRNRLPKAASAALAIALMGAGVAVASTPAAVSYVSCWFVNGGNVIVAPDSAVSITFGVSAATESQLRSIVAASTMYIAVDNEPAVASRTFSAPTHSVYGWLATWTYDTSRVVASGQSMNVYLNWYVSRKVWDGNRDEHNKPLKFGPGFQLPMAASCTITAS